MKIFIVKKIVYIFINYYWMIKFNIFNSIQMQILKYISIKKSYTTNSRLISNLFSFVIRRTCNFYRIIKRADYLSGKSASARFVEP